MAKASEADIDAALTLAGMLGDISREYYPRQADGEQPENAPAFFDENDENHLRSFVRELRKLDIGSINRVIFGFQTVASNHAFDPTQDTLNWHPDLAPAVLSREDNGIAAFRLFREKLAIWKMQTFPFLTVVHVDCNKRYKGQAIVNAKSDCPPDSVSCLLGNGNTWWYPIESCTPIKGAKNYDLWIRRYLLDWRRNNQKFRLNQLRKTEIA